MFGWSIRARAWRSASKRAMTCVGVHAGLDDLQGHPAADGLFLLGHEDGAHAALADLLEQLVGADDRAGTLVQAHGLPGAVRVLRQLIDDPGGRGMGAEQGLDPLAQVGIARTGLIEIARPLLGRMALDGVQEDLPGSGECRLSWSPPSFWLQRAMRNPGPKIPKKSRAHDSGGE